MIDLKDISRMALETSKERERLGQFKSDTFSILKHCAGEVSEALEALFHWKYFKGKRNKNHLAEELADVITCALIAAAKEDVDIETALLRVQKKNLRRVKDD